MDKWNLARWGRASSMTLAMLGVAVLITSIASPPGAAAEMSLPSNPEFRQVSAAANAIAVTGLVTFDERSLPVKDRRVTLEWFGDTGTGRVFQRVVSDSTGAFAVSLPAGAYSVTVIPFDVDFQTVIRGRVPGTSGPDSTPITVVAGGAPVALLVPQKGSAAGQVTRPDGRPVGTGDVEVYARICDPTCDSSSQGWGDAKSDAQGNYRIDGLPSGRYALSYSYTKDHAFQVKGPQTYVVISDAAPHQTISPYALAPSHVVQGTVMVGARPARAGEVRVLVKQYSQWTGIDPLPNNDVETFTRSDGTFEALGLWSTMPVAFEEAVYAGHDVYFDYQGAEGYEDRWLSAAPAQTAAGRIHLGAAPSRADITLRPEARMSGKVTTAAGAPIPGASVSLRAAGEAGAEIAKVIAAADGTYSFNTLPQGGYTIVAWMTGYEPQAYGNDPVREPGGSVVVNISAGDAMEGIDIALYRGATVDATLTCTNCEGWSGYLVWLQRLTTQNGATSWQYAQRLVHYMDNVYRATATVYPGTYRIVLTNQAPYNSIATASVEPQHVEDGGALMFDVEYEVKHRTAYRDFDGNMSNDVLSISPDGRLTLHGSDGAGGWLTQRAVGSDWSSFTSVFSPGDFTGDGHSDVLARAANGMLYLYPGNGAGGWLPSRIVGSGWQAFTAILSPGDFTGDGRPDVLARTTNGTLYLYPGDGAGGWLPSRIVGSGWQAFTAIIGPGDFDGDGHSDVLARTADGTLYLYPGSGSGGWLAPRAIGSGWQSFTAIFAVGDFDGDAQADVIAQTAGGVLYLYPGNGSGGWKSPKVIASGWRGFTAVR